MSIFSSLCYDRPWMTTNQKVTLLLVFGVMLKKCSSAVVCLRLLNNMPTWLLAVPYQQDMYSRCIVVVTHRLL